MPFDPKLRACMAEIVLVMQKHDAGGFIMLNSKTHAEFKFRIDEPSWSCLEKVIYKNSKFAGWNFKMRKAHADKVDATAGLIYGMRDMAGRVFQAVEPMIKQIEKHAEVTHNPGPIDRGPDYE